MKKYLKIYFLKQIFELRAKKLNFDLEISF